MGVPAGISLHARHRDGPDRRNDYRKTAPVFGRRRRQLAAGLILAATSAAPAEPLRIATFHTELGRDGPGLLLRDILGGDPQVIAVIEVVNAVNPDVLFLAGLDWDLEGHAVRALADATGYPHSFTARPNRGLPTGQDRDGDGRLGEPEDAEGYGAFTGAEGAALLSRWPLGEVISLTDLPWSGGLRGEDLPDMRLSTTVHWDVAVLTPEGPVRLWAYHATAPVFDGPEDRNGRRNHDETQFWVDRLDGATDPVVVLGTVNTDPADGDGRPEALLRLLEILGDPRPGSAGGLAEADPGHTGDASLDTVDWPADGPGNLRVDYVLPDRSFRVLDAGVLWPIDDDSALSIAVRAASRHRLVWVDVIRAATN